MWGQAKYFFVPRDWRKLPARLVLAVPGIAAVVAWAMKGSKLWRRK